MSHHCKAVANHGNLTHRHRNMETGTAPSTNKSQAQRADHMPTLQHHARLRARTTAQQRRTRPHHTLVNGRQRPRRQPHSHMPQMQPIKRPQGRPEGKKHTKTPQNQPKMVNRGHHPLPPPPYRPSGIARSALMTVFPQDPPRRGGAEWLHVST